MSTVSFLILFPLVPAILLALIPQRAFRAGIVRLSSAVIAAASIYAAWVFLPSGSQFFNLESHALDLTVFGCEMLLSVVLLVMCRRIKAREWWIPVLVVVQACIMAFCELGCTLPHVARPLYTDNFSIVMVLIIGIIGTLICVYAISYMRDYHHHHHDIRDRQPTFFFILFLFLSAMFGVVLANNLMWLYLCWEVTTLCSFVLIGYSRDETATRNAYRALGFNLLGGLGFAVAILYLVRFCPEPTIELDRLIAMAGSPDAAVRGAALLVAILISFAGLAKSAQMPFSSWLLGAMVAPTPVSALLHSSTMVKAGVFIIVKFAPVLAGGLAGYLLACVGGFTFLVASLIAVTQSNAKRVLAYSTVANLGLVVMCAGVGTPAAVWAAIMLIIFHAVAKGLLFLGTGTIEHRTGSRDIEDMEGLIVSRPALGLVMVIGMLGMFLAPFGMLISKWVCLEAFVRVGNYPPVLALLLAFGSAPTVFFWTKWMGKVITVPAGGSKLEGKIGGDEWTALGILAVMTVLAAACFPAIGRWVVEPFLSADVALGTGNLIIMFIMLGLIVVLPLGFFIIPARTSIANRYLAGLNVDATARFTGPMGTIDSAVNRSHYLSGFFSERVLAISAIWLTVITMAAMLGAAVL